MTIAQQSKPDYVPVRRGEVGAYIHECGYIEWFVVVDSGGCDACESSSDNPADWRPLYVAAQP